MNWDEIVQHLIIEVMIEIFDSNQYNEPIHPINFKLTFVFIFFDIFLYHHIDNITNHFDNLFNSFQFFYFWGDEEITLLNNNHHKSYALKTILKNRL